MRDTEEDLLNIFGFILLVVIVLSPTLKIALYNEWAFQLIFAVLVLLSFLCYIYRGFAMICCKIESYYINKELTEYNKMQILVNKNINSYNEQFDNCLKMKDIYDKKYAKKTDDESLQYFYHLVETMSIMCECKTILDDTVKEMETSREKLMDKINDIETRYEGIATINKIEK